MTGTKADDAKGTRPLMLISKAANRYKAIDSTKTATGAFFTKGASWLTKPVQAFITEHTASNRHILDPFAGEGDLLKRLASTYGATPHGYDIAEKIWQRNDSLIHVPNPHGALICTNPPYLAKHSAKRKGVWDSVGHYYATRYDLYEVAIEKSMAAAEAGIFIIPETFLHSDFPKDHLRLVSVILDNPFVDTENPVCVACFDKAHHGQAGGQSGGEKGSIYIGDEYLCHLSKIDRSRYKTARDKGVSFNDSAGSIALKAVDGVDAGDKIRFMPADKFYYSTDKIKESSRLMTYIKIESLNASHRRDFILLANEHLRTIRKHTGDLILSPFKGNNKDGTRRRRLDYALARYIINATLEEMLMEKMFIRPQKAG